MLRLSRLSCRGWGAAVIAAAAAVSAVGCDHPAGVARDTSPAISTTAPATSTAVATARAPCRGDTPTRYRHVIWVWMENHNYDSIIGSKDAPFTNHLAAECGLATNYHNITHPSLPNYVAATSGSTLGITDDCSPSECSQNAQSLFGQVQAAGLTWKTYSESMPTVCDLQDGTGLHPPGDYVAHHNPAVYYLPLRSQCDQAVVPLGTPTSGAFAQALGSDSLPAFSFVSPNLCDSTHDCPVSGGDLWLSQWVRAIVSSRAYRAGTTALFITWDEGEQGGSDDCAFDTGTAGCHVPMVVVSPSTRPGTRATDLFNHYSLLKTTEQLLGISPFLAQANDPRTKSMAEGFNLSSG